MGRFRKDRPARSHSPGARAGAVRRGSPSAPGPAFPALAPVGALALVLVAGAWLQISALRLPFFADDYLFLDQIRGRSLWAALTSPDPLRNFWRPVGRQLYFWLVARSGESTVVAHVLNLLIFLGIVAMLFVLARRLAGTRAAVIAASVLALHYVADVPVRWASGSQDLIAVAGALGALCLVASGRNGWAAASLGLGLLAKETVVLTPLVAVWLARRPGQRWTRSLATLWPLGAVVAVWAVFWTLAMQGRSGGTIHFSLDAIPAAPIHLVQVFLGAEWSRYQPLRLLSVLPPLIPLALALVGIALVGRQRSVSQGRCPADPESPSAWSTGLLWALLATLPVVLVVHIWSAYYYLFALCGLALMLGALLARRPLAIALVATTLLVWGSESARRLETFATDPSPWCTQSHLNRFYFDRSMWWVTRYLQDLRRQRPTLPHRSTLFFSGLQFFSSWQAADGPLIRWAYRDSSLRSYYFHDFTAERARRGPFFVYVTRNDSLIEQKPGPEVLFTVAASQLISERYPLAKDVLGLARERYPKMMPVGYWLAWVEMALGDTAAARRELTAAGLVPRFGSNPQTAAARRLLAAGDTLGAASQVTAAISSHVFDSEAHGLLADILMGRSSGGSIIEALAACQLTPRDPPVWRRWAILQMRAGNYQAAYPSMRRYFKLAGPAARGDEEARQMLEFIRKAQPGGELAQSYLRRRPKPRD
jgi:hypothetical protein